MAYSNSQLEEQTQNHMSRINNQLDALVDITSQQKTVARSLGNELDDQNKMIADQTDHMDQANNKVMKATAHVKEAQKKTANNIGWGLVILLIVGIILVWVL